MASLSNHEEILEGLISKAMKARSAVAGGLSGAEGKIVSVMKAKEKEQKAAAQTNCEGLDEYWQLAMKRRMPFIDEVDRLLTVLRGFHSESTEQIDLLDFYDGKRPYGNKDVPASIAFNLGWDFERRLCREAVPAFVAEEAIKLHMAVGERIAS